MGKTIHNVVLNRRSKEPFGFRIIGGKDEGLSFKVRAKRGKVWSLNFIFTVRAASFLSDREGGGWLPGGGGGAQGEGLPRQCPGAGQHARIGSRNVPFFLNPVFLPPGNFRLQTQGGKGIKLLH